MVDDHELGQLKLYHSSEFETTFGTLLSDASLSFTVMDSEDVTLDWGANEDDEGI